MDETFVGMSNLDALPNDTRTNELVMTDFAATG
jgi:hypothetical protein